MKRRMFLLTVMLAVLTLLTACQQPAPVAKTEVNYSVLKGPTGIGSSYLLEQNSTDSAANKYVVTVAAEATEIVSMLASGQADIAAIPTNVAAALYNKTNGGIKVIALNTAGVLYILEKGQSISSIADLKGRTVYAIGQGANPEYVLKYLLFQNGLEADKDVKIEFLDSAELTARAASGEVEVCMLPVPAATTVLLKNKEMFSALDLSREWEKLNNGSSLIMGCVVVRTEFYENNKAAVEKFLKEYEESINYVKNNPETAGSLCEKFEIVPNAQIAVKAIPDANLIFISGKEIRANVEGYYKVLLEADSKAVGGALPKDDFYPAE